MALELDIADTAAPPAPTLAKPRRWWVAAIMSLMVPGLGQLYAICPKRAGWILAVVTAIDLSLGLLLGYVPPVRMETIIAVAILAVLVVVIRLYSAADAAVIAWYGGTPVLQRYNRLAIYLVIAAGWTAASHFGLAGARANGILWQSYIVDDDSMSPGLQRGDYVLAWAGYYRDHVAVPGEVAVVIRDDGRKQLLRVREAPTSAVPLPENYLMAGDKEALAPPRLVPAGRLTDRPSIVVYSRDSGRIGMRIGPEPATAKE